MDQCSESDKLLESIRISEKNERIERENLPLNYF